MARPEPIEWYIKRWEITWARKYFDSSAATGTCHYEAIITYAADVSPSERWQDRKIETRDERKIFTTFEKAKEWIDEEIKT